MIVVSGQVKVDLVCEGSSWYVLSTNVVIFIHHLDSHLVGLNNGTTCRMLPSRNT